MTAYAAVSSLMQTLEMLLQQPETKAEETAIEVSTTSSSAELQVQQAETEAEETGPSCMEVYSNSSELHSYSETQTDVDILPPISSDEQAFLEAKTIIFADCYLSSLLSEILDDFFIRTTSSERPFFVIPFQRQQIAALYSQLASLEAFLKNPPDPNIFNDDTAVLKQLEIRIGHAAQEALDFVDCKIAGFKLEDFRKNPPDPYVLEDDAVVPKAVQIGWLLMAEKALDICDHKIAGFKLEDFRKNPPDPDVLEDDAAVPKIAGFKLEDFRKNPPDPDVLEDDAAVPKGCSANEYSCTTPSKKSRKRKTFTELIIEEATVRLKERVNLQRFIWVKQELASLRETLNEQRAKSESLKRIKQLKIQIRHAAQEALDFVGCKIAGFKLEDFRKNPPDPDVLEDDAAVPKGCSANEYSCTTPSKKSRKRKTFTELIIEEVTVRLKERVNLQRELASLRETLNKQRAKRENLTRIKTFTELKEEETVLLEERVHLQRTTETQITPSNKATQIDLPHEDGKGKAVDVDALNGFESLYPQIEEMISINAEVKIISDKKICGTRVLQTEISLRGQSSLRSVNEEVNLVGFCKDVETMVDCLTSLPLQLTVFRVVGMAGIGKTTFTRRVYNDPFVSHHFYIRSWITISQCYQVKELLLGLLNCFMKLTDEVYEKSTGQLRELLHRSLKLQKYLIVLDDMWDSKAWDDLKSCFPDDKNGSRIILTSRYREVAAYAASNSHPYLKQMPFLTTDESWELFCLKVFASRSCPPELVNLGRQIVGKCGGLPLAVVVVAGLLSKIGKTQEIWEKVAGSAGSLLMEDPERYWLKLLALSYDHLPNHLKACFLYIGIFPEDTEIPVWKLIWLWIAEGFIQPTELKCLEEVAEEYLEDLVARSLILDRMRRSDGGIKTCCIHDLMRDFCLREVKKEKLFHVFNPSVQGPQADLFHLRRLIFRSDIRQYFSSRPPIALLHTFLCFETFAFWHIKYGSIDFMGFKLLKVLDIIGLKIEAFPLEISLLVLLRYLAISVETRFPYLAPFRFLQTLVVDCMWDGYLPEIIWAMPGLRNLCLKKRHVAESHQYPPWTNFDVRNKNLENLQTLSMICPRCCTCEVFVSIPNLRKLGVYECEEDYQDMKWFNNLVHLQKLQALKYIFANPFARPARKLDRLPMWDAFPPNLKKLALGGTSFPWEDMLTVGKLPNLEVLKLRNYAFSGTYWEQSEGGFCRLKFLLISSTDLERWNASSNCFPRLKHLVLRHCKLLREIPYGVAEAPALQTIQLHCCGDSVKRSAQQLRELQQSLGNDEPAIHITER